LILYLYRLMAVYTLKGEPGSRQGCIFFFRKTNLSFPALLSPCPPLDPPFSRPPLALPLSCSHPLAVPFSCLPLPAPLTIMTAG
jgi:hypothetical protein